MKKELEYLKKTIKKIHENNLLIETVYRVYPEDTPTDDLVHKCILLLSACYSVPEELLLSFWNFGEGGGFEIDGVSITSIDEFCAAHSKYAE